LWSDGASNGGQPILDYRISFDQGSGNWAILQTGITTKELVATGASPGVTYYFKIEARNVIGYSGESAVFGIKAAIKPTSPTGVTTSRSLNDVILTWTPPSVDSVTDYGDVIIGYRIYFRTNVYTQYEQDLINCPDTDLDTVVCTLPVSALQNEPFNLALGESIYAKVIAFNTIGDSPDSSPGNGAIVSIVVAPDAPVDL
jgi:hypothetical protein